MKSIFISNAISIFAWELFFHIIYLMISSLFILYILSSFIYTYWFIAGMSLYISFIIYQHAFDKKGAGLKLKFIRMLQIYVPMYLYIYITFIPNADTDLPPWLYIYDFFCFLLQGMGFSDSEGLYEGLYIFFAIFSLLIYLFSISAFSYLLFALCYIKENMSKFKQ